MRPAEALLRRVGLGNLHERGLIPSFVGVVLQRQKTVLFLDLRHGRTLQTSMRIKMLSIIYSLSINHFNYQCHNSINPENNRKPAVEPVLNINTKAVQRDSAVQKGLPDPN